MPESILGLPFWYAALLIALVALIAALSVYDIRTRRIPNAVVYPAIAVALVVAVLNPVAEWYVSLLAGLIAGVVLVVIAVASRGGMGMGDVKLGVVVGLVAGWPSVLVALFVAFASGALIGLALIATGKLGRREGMPFAPALLIGTITALAVGPQVIHLLFPGVA